MSLPPVDHCRPSRVSVPQDSFIGFPTGPWQSASTLPCSTDCLLDVPQCGPMGSQASSKGCCWVPTPRLIIHLYIEFWFWFRHFSSNVQMRSSFVQENLLCIAGASFPSVSRGLRFGMSQPLDWLPADGFPIFGAHQSGHPCIFSRTVMRRVQRDHVEAMQGFLRRHYWRQCLTLVWRGGGFYLHPSYRGTCIPVCEVLCQLCLGACNFDLLLFSP